MGFYTHKKLSDRIYRITEIDGVCCYLVVGDEKAALLDTGCGIGNIKEYIEKITDKPIIVILSHGHHDHTGGAVLFDEVYFNHDDMPVFEKFNTIENRYDYIKDHYPEIKTEDLVPTRTAPMIDYKEGKIFDLGNCTIEMIEVKGHTPSMMVPLCKEERTIFFGDACGVCVLLFDEFSSDVSTYLKSLEHLKTFENQYDKIYRNHGTFWSPKSLLDNDIELCHLILEKKDDHYPMKMFDKELFAAKEFVNGQRVDGKEGNILYTIDKAK